MSVAVAVAIAVAVAFVNLIHSSCRENQNDGKYTILPTVPVTMVSELCTVGVVVVVVVVIIAIPISIAIADCNVANVAFYLCCFVAVLLYVLTVLAVLISTAKEWRTKI